MSSSAVSADTRPVKVTELSTPAAEAGTDCFVDLLAGERTALVVRGALSADTVRELVDRVANRADEPAWDRPNAAMPGGDLEVWGEAATPTFRTPTGPSLLVYLTHAAEHDARMERLLGPGGDPWPAVRDVLSEVAGGRPVRRPVGPSGRAWPPFTLRSLGEGQQIFPHHDDHYGLSVYTDLDSAVDRGALLSWFVTLQAPDEGGQLVAYGLRGTDPDPPMLPTRFLDTDALDAGYVREEISLAAGDLVVFDSGRHVHRVCPVRGTKPRLTMGGFLGAFESGSALACWS